MSKNSISCGSRVGSSGVPGLEPGPLDDFVVPAVANIARLTLERAAECPHAVFRNVRLTTRSDLRVVFKRWLGRQLGERFKGVHYPEFVSPTRLKIKVGDSGRYALLDLPMSLASFLEAPPEWIQKKIGKNRAN
jgi:hypothetical protein